MVFKLVIDRIEEEIVVCITEKHQKVIVPISCMPDEVGEGDVIYMEIHQDKEATANSKINAKELLNELLQGENATKET